MRKTFSISILLCCILLSACTAAPPSQEPITKTTGDYLIYKIRDKLTFYDLAEDVHVPILPDWEISDFSINSNGVLAFSSAHDGDVDIYLLDYPFTENEPRNITNELDSDDFVELWSSDGQFLAFESKTLDSKKILSIWNDNSISRIYEYRGELSEYSWNMDGQLVFTEFYYRFGANKPSEIFLWDGDTLINFSLNPAGSDRSPAWSEDGQLAFNSYRERECNIFIWDGESKINAMPDVNSYETIASDLISYLSDPVWTSSGTITFSGERVINLTIFEWNRKKVQNISKNPFYNSVGQSWSEDGYWAFYSYYNDVIIVRDEKNRTILKTKGKYIPAWSDDGSLMFCVREESIGWGLSIWDGENTNTLIEIDDYIYAEWPNGKGVTCSSG